MGIGDLVVVVFVLGGGSLALLVLFACATAADPESWAESLEDAVIVTHLTD